MRSPSVAGKYILLLLLVVSSVCRQGNPDIQAWMKKMGYTDYAKLEEYYENK